MIHINTKQWIIAGAITLCMTSCGENKPAENNSDTPDEQTETKSVELTAIATSAQVEKAYNDILKKAGVTDPELMEFSISFHKMGRRSNGYLNMQMVSPKDKNKIVNYSYNFETSVVDEPVEVTLSTGIGTNEKFIDKYDDFKEFLYKKSDMINFGKLDNVYKEAIEKSTYKPDECYIDVVTIKKDSQKITSYLKVQSTKSITAYKNMDFDNDGKLKI